MLKRLFPAFGIIFLLGSCSNLKQLGFSGSKKNPGSSQPVTSANTESATTSNNTEIKFLEEISTSVQPTFTEVSSNNSKKTIPVAEAANLSEPVVVKDPPVPSALQFKYAMMLGTEASEIQNLKLFEFIDDWYGTRYRMGGTTKRGIDCSALVQLLFLDIYSLSVPRTSKEQYRNSKRISLTELQEGDLLFFHTRGRGVSHVGIYLANNKFVHAASSGGVMISDMYEPYFVKRLIAAGRISN